MAAPPLTIKLRCTSWQQVSALYERDLLRSGLFLKSAAPPPIGTPVRINLTLPTQTLIVLSGRIASHVGRAELYGRGPGIDIKLQSVPNSALWLIESALASARSAGALPQESAHTASAQPGTGAAHGRGAGDMDMVSDDGLVAAEKELIHALQAEFDGMRKRNPFQVLGVDHRATDTDVRAAFAVLTKRFHPDRYTRYESREAHRLAAEIFILVRNAYQHLDTAAKRAHTHSVLLRRRAASQRSETMGQAAGAVPTQPAPPVPPAPAPRRPEGDDEPEEPTVEQEQSAPASPPTEIRPHDESPEGELARGYQLLEADRPGEARDIFKLASVRNPDDPRARIGLELSEGLIALGERDRLEAAQRFELVLELDPNNDQAARMLAEMRRQATAERKDHMARLLGQK